MTGLAPKLATYGQWTYRGAWALEITAAAIGLATGLVLGYQASTAGSSVSSMELVLASAPFFMVALAELTKIPVATLLFAASWVWKPVLGVFLLALAFITFQTVFIGLEKAAALRELQYDQLSQDTRVLAAEKLRIEEIISQSNNDRGTEEAQAEIELINRLASEERSAIETQIASVEKELTAPASSPRATALKETIEDREGQLSDVLARRDRELDREGNAFESQRDSFVSRIETALQQGQIAVATRWQSELARLKNPRSEIEQRHQGEIQSLEAELQRLRSELDTLRLEGAGQIDPEVKRALQQDRDALRSLLRDINTKWRGRLDQARAGLAEAQERAFSRAQQLESYRERLDGIASELGALETERIPMARTDQVRRIASKLHGVQPENVSQEQAALVSLFWFGSLGGLAALAGPITAMVALGLQRTAERREKRTETRLARLVRRWMLNWRFRRTKTVRVPKEVLVDKEVEKIVEVPVESVVKEILYVPILTDDPEAVRRALQEGVPAEVADLVKVTTKGQKRARPA